MTSHRKQPSRFENLEIQDATVRLGDPLRTNDDSVYQQSRATMLRRAELLLDGTDILLTNDAGSIDLALFPADENVQLHSIVMSLDVPNGYQVGIGRSDTADLVPYTAAKDGRVEAISGDGNGLLWLSADTPLRLLVSGASQLLTITGKIHVTWTTMGDLDLSDAVDSSGVDQTEDGGVGGYELTGGFVERTTGSSGSNDLGSNFQYTTAMAEAKQWKRFGFSAARQAANDVQYWGETNPDFDQTKGLFGGLHMPAGVTRLFDFTDTSLEAEVNTGDLQYTEAAGSYDFRECRVGDRAAIRFSFNLVPQHANTTVEIGLIWATRDENDNVTFTFPLTTQPIFFGTGSVGNSFLNRVEITAYFASDEDVNARALPAIRADNEILIQPLTTLCTIQR